MPERKMVPYDGNNNLVRKAEVFGEQRLESDRNRKLAPKNPDEMVKIARHMCEFLSDKDAKGIYIRPFPINEERSVELSWNPGTGGVTDLEKSPAAIVNFRQYDYLSEKGVYVPAGKYHVSESLFIDRKDGLLKIEKDMVRKSNKRRSVSATKLATYDEMEEALSVLAQAINNDDKTNPNMLPGVTLDAAYSSEDYDRKRSFAVFTAEKHMLVGGISIRFINSGRKELDDVYILEEYRGLGYGQAALVAANELEHNGTTPPLTTFEHEIANTPAALAIDGLRRRGLVTKYYSNGAKENKGTYVFKHY